MVSQSGASLVHFIAPCNPQTAQSFDRLRMKSKGLRMMLVGGTVLRQAQDDGWGLRMMMVGGTVLRQVQDDGWGARMKSIKMRLPCGNPAGALPLHISPVATGPRSPFRRRERRERGVFLSGSINAQIPCDLGDLGDLGVETAPSPAASRGFLDTVRGGCHNPCAEGPISAREMPT